MLIKTKKIKLNSFIDNKLIEYNLDLISINNDLRLKINISK